MLDSLSVNAGYSQALTNGYSQKTKASGDGNDGVGALLKSLQNSEGDVLELGKVHGKGPSAETILAILEEKVNKNVEKAFPGEEVENPLSDDYWSPEKTAERIVGFALKFYDRYSEKNGGESEANLDKYLSIVTGAIDQGFSEARATIGEHNGGTVPEKNAGTITSTRDHIAGLLSEFRATVMERISATSPPVETPVEAPEESAQA